MSQQVQLVVTQSQKSPFLGVILSLFFGSLGLIYSSPKAALIMFIPFAVCTVASFFLIGIPFLIICNIISAVWAYKACEAYNQQLIQQLTGTQSQQKAA